MGGQGDVEPRRRPAQNLGPAAGVGQVVVLGLIGRGVQWSGWQGGSIDPAHGTLGAQPQPVIKGAGLEPDVPAGGDPGRGPVARGRGIAAPALFGAEGRAVRLGEAILAVDPHQQVRDCGGGFARDDPGIGQGDLGPGRGFGGERRGRTGHSRQHSARNNRHTHQRPSRPVNECNPARCRSPRQQTFDPVDQRQPQSEVPASQRRRCSGRPIGRPGTRHSRWGRR